MADQPGMLGGYQLETQVADNAWIGVRAGHRFLVRLVGTPVDGPALGRVPPMCTVRVVDGGPGYVVSELVEGPSLQSLVSGAGPRGGEELDRIAVRTLTALSAIHQAGLVHGSFGPASVLLAAEGAVVDGYGVARGGVPAYAAPEQVAADQFTAAGDLFAWAATMVYAATGRPPFGEGEAAGIFNRVLQGEPDLGALDGSLRGVVASCLVKDPAGRPTAQTAQQLLISGVPSTRGSVAFKQPPAKPPAPKPQRDLRVPIAAGAAAFLVVGAATGWALLRPAEEPKRAVLAGNEQAASPSRTDTPTPAVLKKTRKPRPKPTPTPTTQPQIVIPQPQVTVTKTRVRTPKPKQTTHKPSVPPARESTPTPEPTKPQPQPQVQSHRLVNGATGMCLVIRDNEARAGKEVAQYQCNQFPQQQWILSGGSVVNKGTGMCLAIGNGEKKPGKYAIQWPCLGSAAQKWTYDGSHRLRNQATGLCLAIGHGEAKLGKYAIQWNCLPGAEQRWSMG